MESYPQRPHKLGHLADSSDATSVSGISNILVATIQEAKDKISQIELLFHNQLIPKFQLTSQSWKKTYSESSLAADIAHKETDNHSLFKIKKLECAEQQVLVDNQLLKLASIEFINMERESFKLRAGSTEKNVELNEGREIQKKLRNFIESKESLIRSYENAIQELKEKDTALLEKQKALALITEELRLEVVNKSKEVDEVIEMQAKLIFMNQSKASSIVQKEKQLKEYEDKTSDLTNKLANAEKIITELQSALREKTDELDNGKELLGNLLKKNEYQASEILNTKQLSSKYDKENGLLITKVEVLSHHADELQKELDMKINELEKERQSYKQLLQQIDALNLERIKMGQEFEEFEKERKMFQDNKKYLEGKVDMLQEYLYERGKESSEGMELHGKLLQQIQEKNSELESQKRKRREVIAAYKRMKSQYNSLRESSHLTPENMLAGNKTEDESEEVNHGMENDTSKAFDNINLVPNQKGVEEIVQNKNEAGFQISSPVSASKSSNAIPTKCPTSAKSCPISCWRNTRSHQSRLGSDPHDDFLDTPLEKLRENVGKAMEAGELNLQESGSVKTDMGNSNDETQDMSMHTFPQQHQMAPKSSVFKYVEPTRKKSERENLNGVECKQCSKFYDAVHPDSNKIYPRNKKSIRCEHHDGVSRHRYRYAPSSTPDGFWNIEFESET